MKTWPAALVAHLRSRTTTLCTICKVPCYDGTIQGFIACAAARSAGSDSGAVTRQWNHIQHDTQAKTIIRPMSVATLLKFAADQAVDRTAVAATHGDAEEQSE